MGILKGIGTSPYIGVGAVKKIKSHEDILTIKGGEIVVVQKASRDMLSHLRRAGGVVTDYGGLTSHVAIVLRELKIPCVVGCENATQILEDEMIITVDGKTGNIYRGFIELGEEREFFEVYHPSTNIKVNINVPEISQEVAPLSDGVGSIRIEGMIIHTGKHPYVLADEGKLTEVIVDGVREIVDAFYPKPVWFRTFDIPTDELKSLRGGDCEPDEANPLLGLRGIYKDLRDVEILKAEFEAIRCILEEGYHNIGLKIPFLRDISEYVLSKKILKKAGIKPHKDIDVGASIEIPSAALTLDDFIKEGVDFISIGMSDLTMCCLAIDRRSAKVAKHFDLMHPAVLGIVEMVIKKCNEKGIESCVCGYAATDPVIVKKLVEFGISSISTNPDQVLRMRKTIANVEEALIKRGLS